MMQLTPQQHEQIQAAKNAGETRATITFTAEQEQEWKANVASELAGKDETIAHHQKIQTAAEEPGFLGDLRRAITYSRRPIQELAEELGIAPRLLSEFRAVEAELPSAVLAKLVKLLSLRLMHEIPASVESRGQR